MIFIECVKWEEAKLQLFSSNEYLFNKNNKPQKYNGIPPVYISIPVIAFRVSYIEHNNPENIIETTIVKLKKIGYSKERIAKTLCMDEHLVNDVLAYYGDSSSIDTKPLSQKSKTAYVFYDCFNHKYFDWYMGEDEYRENTDLYITDRQRYSFKFKSSISDSFEYFVRMLQNPDENIDVGMVPKQEEILRIFQGQKRHQAISSSYYSNAEYLNESRVLQMVCTCYLDARDCTDFTIANPIYEGQAKTLWYKIKEMLNVYSDDNQQICNDLQNIKERLILTTDDLNTSDINKAICEYLLKKYGNSIKYHDDVYKKFIQLERSYSELRSAVQQKGTVADSQTELARFQVDSHSLLEEVFYLAFKSSYDDEMMFKIGHISKNNSSPELLRAHILRLGFECDDETIYDFLKGVTISSLKAIFSQPDGKISKKINTMFVVNVICGSIRSTLPICTLGYKMPRLVQALQKTLAMRNPAKHGNSQIKLLSISECDEIYNYCHRVAEIMLQLNDLCPEIESYDFIKHEVSPQVQILVNEELKKVSTDNSELYDKAKTMCESFYEKQESSFFVDCRNYLHSLYFTYLDKLSDNETRMELLKNVPDDKELMRDYINRILSYNGIRYSIKSVINKNKLFIDFNDDEKITLTGAMYLTILFIQDKDPALFKKIKDFDVLLEVTDRVVSMRGHSELADFSNNEEECKELLIKLLTFIQKEEV